MTKIGSAVVFHTTGLALTALLVAAAIIPKSHMSYVTDTVTSNEVVFGLSQTALLLHLGLAACLWAMGYIVWLLGKTNFEQRKVVSIKRAAGSVMTETLIIMPVFLLLAFGMAQLAINNIAGILANVAVYEAGRSAWVWKPEEDAANKRMGVSDGIAAEKAKIAIALVMMPVAPGEFVSDQDIGEMGGKMRCAALLSHVPLGGSLGVICDGAGAAADISTTIDQLTGSNTLDDSSLARAVDTTPFIQRTYTKFTHAMHSSNVTVNADTSVEMNYDHLNAMPVVSRVFGTAKTVGGRKGYYSTFVRNYGFTAQINTPNPVLPDNDIGAVPEYPEPGEGSITDITGDG